ncbi:hypothetical protein [Sediminitomix flava]|uniref:CHRD domain-containing protein n=1 Tax=Sediminitomix flava TaxID=379075 RepID=A0A315ZWA1_SEDFL|nr:hypothetical protein [Sediminitomix flava]PWJ40963.1 hypothetical protein BC781_104229 [Sediminitomix flava]
MKSSFLIFCLFSLFFFTSCEDERSILPNTSSSQVSTLNQTFLNLSSDNTNFEDFTGSAKLTLTSDYILAYELSFNGMPEGVTLSKAVMFKNIDGSEREVFLNLVDGINTNFDEAYSVREQVQLQSDEANTFLNRPLELHIYVEEANESVFTVSLNNE